MRKNTQTIRIIGGKWRSRRIKFIAEPGVRPTTDMVRETLFNWLSSNIVGAKCLDMFAGSGALGFEALSRGANSVLMIDKSPAVIKNIKENAALLNAEDLKFLCGEVPKALSKITDQIFDVVFLDPPFHKNLLPKCLEYLEKNNLLKQGALVYVEAEKDLDLKEFLPVTWEMLKHKISGQVGYFLLRKILL